MEAKSLGIGGPQNDTIYMALRMRTSTQEAREVAFELPFRNSGRTTIVQRGTNFVGLRWDTRDQEFEPIVKPEVIDLTGDDDESQPSSSGTQSSTSSQPEKQMKIRSVPYKFRPFYRRPLMARIPIIRHGAANKIQMAPGQELPSFENASGEGESFIDVEEDFEFNMNPNQQPPPQLQREIPRAGLGYPYRIRYACQELGCRSSLDQKNLLQHVDYHRRRMPHISTEEFMVRCFPSVHFA
ncbi:hypothetical protein V3C99_002642 [Haemonchus contortus]